MGPVSTDPVTDNDRSPAVTQGTVRTSGACPNILLNFVCVYSVGALHCNCQHTSRKTKTSTVERTAKFAKPPGLARRPGPTRHHPPKKTQPQQRLPYPKWCISCCRELHLHRGMCGPLPASNAHCHSYTLATSRFCVFVFGFIITGKAEMLFSAFLSE